MLLTQSRPRSPVPPPATPETGHEPADLIGRIAREADRLAFAELFELFAPRLKGFLMGGGTREGLAEEIVQETMITVWRKAGLFDPARAGASTWIFTIARNKRIDLIRKQNRPEPDFEDPAFQPEPALDGEAHVAAAELRDSLRTLVGQLSGDQMQVVRLSYFDGLTQSQIAERLDIPLGTVKSRLRLALDRLRYLSEGQL